MWNPRAESTKGLKIPFILGQNGDYPHISPCNLDHTMSQETPDASSKAKGSRWIIQNELKTEPGLLSIIEYGIFLQGYVGNSVYS